MDVELAGGSSAPVDAGSSSAPVDAGSSSAPVDAGRTLNDNLVANNNATLSNSLTVGALVVLAFSTSLRGAKSIFRRLAFAVIITATFMISNDCYGIGKDGTKVMEFVACVFYTIIFTIYIGMVPTIGTFPGEMGKFVQENPHTHSMIGFYLVKTLIDMTFLFFFAIIYAVVIYALTSQPFELTRVSIFVSIYAMTTLISYSLALLITVELGAKPITYRVFMALAIVVPFALLAGYCFPSNSIPVLFHWTRLFSYVRYAFEAALIGMYGFGRKDFACENSYCPFRHPSEVLEEFAIDESKFSMDAAALVIIFLALQTFTVGSLHWKIKRNRSTI